MNCLNSWISDECQRSRILPFIVSETSSFIHRRIVATARSLVTLRYGNFMDSQDGCFEVCRFKGRLLLVTTSQYYLYKLMHDLDTCSIRLQKADSRSIQGRSGALQLSYLVYESCIHKSNFNTSPG